MLRRLVPILMLSLPAASALADEQWEITTAVEMTGMPMAMSMPPTTTKVCVPPGEQSREKLVSSGDKNCKVSNFRTSGNSSSFHIECGPPNKMSGDGQVSWSGDSYKGSLKARSTMEGMTMDMKITYNGRKTGACTGDSVNVRALQAQAKNAQVNQAVYTNRMCQEIVNNLAWQGSEYMGQTCPNLKPAICQALTARVNDPLGFMKLQQEGQLEGVAGYCGQDAVALKQQACQAAKSQKRWDAAGALCGDDPELAAVARQECGGLNFTAMPSEDPRRGMMAFCSRYAPKKPAAASGGAIEQGVKAVETINKLRGLFGR